MITIFSRIKDALTQSPLGHDLTTSGGTSLPLLLKMVDEELERMGLNRQFSKNLPSPEAEEKNSSMEVDM